MERDNHRATLLESVAHNNNDINVQIWVSFHFLFGILSGTKYLLTLLFLINTISLVALLGLQLKLKYVVDYRHSECSILDNPMSSEYYYKCDAHVLVMFVFTLKAEHCPASVAVFSWRRFCSQAFAVLGITKTDHKMYSIFMRLPNHTQTLYVIQKLRFGIM